MKLRKRESKVMKIKKISALFLSLIIIFGASYGVNAQELQGKIISSSAVLSNAQVVVDVISEGFEEKSIAIATLLDEEGNILCISSSKIANEFRIEFPKERLGTKVKIFLWGGVMNMQPLCEVVVTEVKKFFVESLKTTMSVLQPGTIGGYAGQFAVENNFVYICRQGRIYKIDISDVETPTVVAENNYSKDVSAKMATAVQINGDYIYVGNRLAKAAYPTLEEEENLLAGAFAVLKKDDLSLVSITPLGQKVSGMALYKNLLIVNLQMLGWSIYDVSDAANPVMLEKIDFPRDKSIETQGGEIFEHEGKVYYAVAGFGDGIRMYDITEFAEYTETPEKFDAVPEIDDSNLLWYYHFYSKGIGGNHTYDLTVKYPYVYATIAATKSQKENPERIQGILTFDITDISEKPTSHTLSLIAVEDKNDMYTNADTEPSIICRIGDTLIVNNDKKGIACFSIGKTPQNPEYIGTYNPLEGSCVFRMMADERGRLFLTDGSGVGAEPKIYIVEGFEQ